MDQTKGNLLKPSVLSAQQAISLAPVGGKGLASSGAGEQLPCLSLVGHFHIPTGTGANRFSNESGACNVLVNK